MSVVRIIVIALLLSSIYGCGPSLKTVHFEFERDGTTIQADKEFNDALGQAPSSKAWPAVEQKKYDRAIAILQEVTEAHPDDAWAHYNLAILYEASGRWDMAESAIRDAIRVDQRVAEAEGRKPTRKLERELRYIERHR